MLRSVFLAGRSVHKLRALTCFQMAFFGKVIPVNLGDLGEGTKEATIKEWFVKPGSEVKEFEDLCEVITDKLVAKIPSSYAGKIKNLHYKPDEICQVGQPLLDMEVDDSVQVKEVAKEEPEKKEAVPETPKESAPCAGGVCTNDNVMTTHAVRLLAKRLNVDITKVPGSGKKGRVMKHDVIDFAEGKCPSKSSPTVPKVASEPVKTEVGDKLVKLSGIRKAMAKSMTDAKLIPHENLVDYYDMTSMTKVRNEYLASNPGQKITFLPFFVKAFSAALHEFPIFNSNSSLGKDGVPEFIEKHEHNISIAIDSPSGLLVPNIKSVQDKTILEVNEDIRQIIKRAKQSAVTHEDLTGGTFTISNIGNLGCIIGTPVIFRPQLAIVALGKVRMVPDYHLVNGVQKVSPKEIITISLSFDQRFIDRSLAARFSSKVKENVENMELLLMGLAQSHFNS